MSAPTTVKLAPVPCPYCDGGYVVEEIPAAAGGFEQVKSSCDACHGTGRARCATCGEGATLLGEDARTPFCTVLHAWEDHCWPACLVCHEDPQDPALGPYCGEACRAYFEDRITFSRPALG